MEVLALFGGSISSTFHRQKSGAGLGGELFQIPCQGNFILSLRLIYLDTISFFNYNIYLDTFLFLIKYETNN